jgi:hypothetical protein
MRVLFAATIAFALQFAPVTAQEFPFNRNPTLTVGQTVLLKGVRAANCRDNAPAWSDIAPGLPKPQLGKLSDGGAGYAMSNRCKARVAARGVRFTATKAGTESFTISGDRFKIVVK